MSRKSFFGKIKFRLSSIIWPLSIKIAMHLPYILNRICARLTRLSNIICLLEMFMINGHIEAEGILCICRSCVSAGLNTKLFAWYLQFYKRCPGCLLYVLSTKMDHPCPSNVRQTRLTEFYQVCTSPAEQIRMAARKVARMAAQKAAKEHLRLLWGTVTESESE